MLNESMHIVIKSVVINVINSIWFSRNQAKFNKKNDWKSIVIRIQTLVTLTGNYTKLTASSSMRDFEIIKKFNININPPKAHTIKEIIWHPPILNWIICNTDGAFISSASSCGGIFRTSNVELLYCFAENLLVCSAFFAELNGVMRAIEIVILNHWFNLWIETNSAIIILVFKSSVVIPFELRNIWENYEVHMNFIVSRIYREGNQCADRLANLGLGVSSLTIWHNVPVQLSEMFL